MKALKVVHFPDTLLKQQTKPLKKLTSEHQQLIDAMLKAMREFPHCVGIAAPQVGYSLPIAVMNSSLLPKGKKEKNHGEIVLVNPRITAHSGQASIREGCLSVPDLTGNTQRYAKITVTLMDRHGVERKYVFEGFEAIVAQHEIDHLNGLLFLDRVVNRKADIFKRKTYK